MPIPQHLLFILLFLPQLSSAQSTTTQPQLQNFNSFNATSYQTFSIEGDAMVNGGALQITPDTQNDDFVRVNRSGRVLLKQHFQLWQNNPNSSIASFNSSFLVNIYRPNNETAGEGIAFLIAPHLNHVPPSSYGQWLGLSNAITDGKTSNQFIAVELDTVKQNFDINDNHIGLNINSVKSVEARNLSEFGIQLAPEIPANYSVWVEYNGTSMNLSIYIAEEHLPKPTNPIIQRKINLKVFLNQQSYFGFAASTGINAQLNCVLRWNLSMEIFPSENEDESSKALLAVAIVVPVVVVGFLGGVLGWWLIRQRRRRKEDQAILGTLKSLPGMPREFEFRDLKKATNNFDDKQKLGQGGFGIVYKGVLADEDKAVAVKMFSRENMKGQDDFLAELTIINRLRHKHLVRLVGWCHKQGTLLLVYDFMPNGSLDDHLFGSSSNEKVLSWERRRNILVGVASALHYLHHEYDQKVVHRDLKASNVLLDSDFNARLGDFGLARALENEKTSYAELEGVPGTMGYIAPECFHTGKATRESDVYSFGAVVLEVVCGQRPRANIEGFQFLVDWVWMLYREARILDAMDARLGEAYVVEEAEKLLLLGLACSHPAPGERPKTPAIVQILCGSVTVPYVPPIKPAFVWPSATGSFSDAGLGPATSESTPMNTSSYCGSGWTPRLDSQESSLGV